MRLALLALLLALPAPARAGNDDTYFVSPEASLVAGAVVATIEEAGAVWYNPAGLASIERHQLDVSMTAVGLQRRVVDGGIEVVGADGSTTREALDGTRIGIGSPASLMARRVGNVTVGGGVVTAREDVISLRGDTPLDLTSDPRSFQSTELLRSDTRLHVGGGLGLRLGERVRLGVAAFLTLESLDDHFTVSLGYARNVTPGASDPPVITGLNRVQRDRSTRWGLQLTAGVQWDATPTLTFGLHVRSPVLLVHESLDYRDVQQQTDPSGLTNFAFFERRAAPVGLLAPARVTLGGAWRNEALTLSAELSYAHALRDLDVRNRLEREGGAAPRNLVDLRHNVTARVGALVPLAGEKALGFGVFTDRSPERRPTGLGDFQVDYYGATLGFRTETRVRLDHERARTLVFRSTFALRYAIGVGRAALLRYDQSNPALTFLPETGETEDVLFHEAYLFLGSSLLF